MAESQYYYYDFCAQLQGIRSHSEIQS